MNIRAFLTSAAIAAAALPGLAAPSVQYLEWGRGPAQVLMTKQEAAQWKTIQTDDEAEAFIALFWARRDPTPSTPANEFRHEFEQRVAWADRNLAAAERVRGAMTDRGKALLLYGMPERIERSATERVPGRDVFAGRLQDDQRSTGDWVQWIYEGDGAKDLFLVPRASIRFVDRMGNNEFVVERGSVDLAAAHQRAIAASITQPELTAPPTFAVTGVAAAAPAATAPAVQTELTTASLQAAVDAFKSAGAGAADEKLFASYGEYVTPEGRYYVPVIVSAPKATGLTAGQSLTFFGVVQDESGKNVLAFEQPATLVGSKDDVYVDKSLALPAGTMRGYFGLADGGNPVAMVATDMQLTGGLDKDATAISPLILSNNVHAVEQAWNLTDPFTFGGVKVVPKADLTFRPSDDLWYFFGLRNPGLADPPAPADGTVPLAPAEPAPRVQVKLDVEGTSVSGKSKKLAAPLREAAAAAMRGTPGHYGVGDAIRLAAFEPGDYTLKVKVIDTVKKTSYTMSQSFRVIE